MNRALTQATPTIGNSDQGSPFTSPPDTSRLLAAGVEINMAGKGRALDNLFTERLWCTVKDDTGYLYGSCPCLIIPQRLQEKGQVTLPADVRRKLGLNKGDLVAVVETPEGVLITPQEVVATRALDRIGKVLKEQGLALEELIESGREERAELIRKQYGTPDQLRIHVATPEEILAALEPPTA